MLFDSHTHLNERSLSDSERRDFVKSVEDEKLEGIVDIGYDLESSMLAVENAKTYPWCYAAVGCHPHDAGSFDELQLELVKSLTKEKKVVAIGEIGLDFYRNLSSPEDQEYWFRRQIRLANELGMPICIHEREAVAKTMEILKEEGAFSEERKSMFPERGGNHPGDARVVIHCFSSSRDIAMQYVTLGATISVAGPLTYRNNRKTVEVVERVPIEYLMIETDAPYLTPEPLRGRRNVPGNVRYTAMKVAEIKDIPYEDVVRITCDNAKRFYGI